MALDEKTVNKTVDFIERDLSREVDRGRISNREARETLAQAKESYKRGNYDRVMESIKDNRRK